jgi:bifunctional DNA-binding transcriptional regulator/antitoxin component of YhaV-PrlF toxin-antitoxin module
MTTEKWRRTMQIRVRGQRIEFLRSKYDPEKKRSTQKLIGAMPKYRVTVPEEILDKMAPKEQEEAIEYVQEQQKALESLLIRSAASDAGETLETVANALEMHPDKVDQEKAAIIYAQIDRITKSLRRAGFLKSKFKKNGKMNNVRG